MFSIRLDDQHTADQATLNAFLERADVVSTTATLVNGSTQFWSVLVFFNERVHAEQHARSSDNHEHPADEKPQRALPQKVSHPADDVPLDAAQEAVYARLRHWRSTQAQTEGVPVYVVAHNSMLQQIAQRGVSSRDELLQIERFGQKRVDKYGDAILDVLASDQDDE
jgi:superfamily II DNA helicase RecQ